MAGNIQWFRWHHGSVNDPKFGRAAKKAGSTLPVVIAIWACILERASAADDRGNYSGLDCADVDYLMGLEDGQTESVIQGMREVGLIDSERVSAWDKRQPKREREDDSSDRVEKHRAEKRQQETKQTEQNNVTPSNASVTQETHREEKRREDIEKKERKEKTLAIARPESVPDQVWSDFLANRKSKKSPLTKTALDGIESEALKARISLSEALAMCCQRGWIGFKAEWMDRPTANGARASPESFGEREQRLNHDKFYKNAGICPPEKRRDAEVKIELAQLA